MTTPTSPLELFKEELNKIYNVEKDLLGPLDAMAASANSLTLKNAFKKHLEESNQQLSRLQWVSTTVGTRLTENKSSAIQSLIDDAFYNLSRDCHEPLLKDALLIAAVQKIEYFEMASYATLRSLALALDLDSTFKLLQQSLNEESFFDEILEGIFDNEICGRSFNYELDLSQDYSDSEKEDAEFSRV